MEELQGRAGRGIALAALAVAYVVVGPAPRLTEALERTYAVAVVEADRQRRRPLAPTDRVPRDLAPTSRWRRRQRPTPARPAARRP